MEIQPIGTPKIVMENPNSLHNYFGWPSVAKLQNGKIAIGASGFRLEHVCPFGKGVIAYSEDEGETYTAPSPVIDTVLDDRDVGIVAFGEKGVIFTSFNNTVAIQREWAAAPQRRSGGQGPLYHYTLAYLDAVSPDAEKEALGSTFRVSQDGGRTWETDRVLCQGFPDSDLGYPATIELSDGSLLTVFYAHPAEGEPAVIMQQKWRFS